ncbi:MAG TPA: hypothetical protein VKA34_12485 [Balneolales bacterium]|nr:hypothetical protein [Balneolales bacterium]
MKQYRYLLITFLLCMLYFGVFPNYVKAQNTSIIPDGFGIEIGAGYNQLFWKARNISGNMTTANRTALSIMPSFRISYESNIYSNISLYSFLGYNEFGGYSKLGKSISFTDPNVLYKDQITFKTLDLGLLGLYKYSDFNVGVGVKVNRHLKIRNRSYYENRPDGQNGWSTNDESFFFGDWSADAGLRFEYLTPFKIVLGAESWFGITNLSNKKYSNDLHIHENHFRLLVGYRF